jgi:hypothetical protein
MQEGEKAKNVGCGFYIFEGYHAPEVVNVRYTLWKEELALFKGRFGGDEEDTAIMGSQSMSEVE